ncbi:hypothetical protein ASPZODRAFT_147028 [Penicilliopsis zonata CBS 506.65]|uniref:Uncharacterized protein n=1 Tax=Penicilliopsis zonata CBS 506.65 TaxID=1073090 RepID=A0A1L9S6R7_9EURO|nr:hypothetical protein ASPZODRAFT_147028 [Penicilliopsis zonata CBS 506.65]OJJ42862.1 hypothetical protein ASPZODRAFT_147028 [Penicilliopsis zonata CBS 506.65]
MNPPDNGVASFQPVHRPDGSATYTCPLTGFNVLGAVNAPIELPARRDALKPEEATLEVFVKPATSSPAVGERYVEGILRNLLGAIILGREKGFPRRGVVLTLAVLEGGDSKATGRGSSYLTLLPALLHTALLALLSASVPMSMYFTTTIIAVTPSGEIICKPSIKDADEAASVHVLAFSSKGHLLLTESEGSFDFDTWEKVHDRALTICHLPEEASAGNGKVEYAVGSTWQKWLAESVEDYIGFKYAYEFA